MKIILTEWLPALGTGMIVGLLFSFLKLPVPAPPSVGAVFGVLGVTLGLLLYGYFFR
ncbi:XapX domain-containing protein [Longirhabdus pacifica]|uniref:XapX domain-containing protein n=1 Tax=Longirhabdus pacifica TaxID=2305227 RepID=UPI0010090B2D|nr:XapX domain-containing protein [Longirhabdus pacifica]